MAGIDPTLVARFWSYVEKRGPFECWPWTGAKDRKGYGLFWRSPSHRAHRFAWSLANGPIPRGLFVCHHCDNPPCVNPAHLFTGTAKDNAHDCIAKGRNANPARLVRVNGERHGSAKLTADDVLRIRAMSASGVANVQINAVYPHMSLNQIQAIVRRDNWRHI